MTSILTGPSRSGMQFIAIPAAVIDILFLGYSSQYLFNSTAYLEPGPLSFMESVVFNALLACLWWTYFRACTVDPGRYVFSHLSTAHAPAKPSTQERRPSSSSSSSSSGSSSHSPTADAGGDPAAVGKRWCKKCNAPKPDRAHHCRHCG